MSGTASDPDLDWLLHADPVGLVVAPRVLRDLDLVPQRQGAMDTAEAAAAIGERLSSFWRIAEILGWPVDRVAGAPGGPDMPDSLRYHLAESDTLLEPHLAVALPEGPGWQLLVRHEAAGIGPDTRGALPGWEATPHQRFERLLRETGVGTGLLVTGTSIRLLHAPRGETSGWLTFPLAALGVVSGRALLAGLKLLLGTVRLFTDAPERRLPAILAESRRAQAAVSTALAGQVLGALHELLRGLYAAEPDRIAELARTRPGHVYEALLAVLMRLVFLLYAEDRDLVPSRADAESRAFYDQGYGVRALHRKLLDDQARSPDTMDERRGAWGRLLALFRLVHQGDGTGWMRGRGGKLFDPSTFPFLMGQACPADPARVPPVTDGCVLRVLDRLMVLGGERLSYRALDVEQIGSVYETVMGFTVAPAPGASIAIKAGKKDRTPVFVDLPALLASRERLKWLKENTDRGKFPAAVERDVRAACSEAQLAAALAQVVDLRGSPQGHVWPAGTPSLQPTDERRRTGSHYTPRDLTNPIVTQALEPAFIRLGPNATPDQVLALKVCDPAMGSGAFLVEACRQLAARLVDAWACHPDTQPTIPADEDEELMARRLVAQRCLYGVDKNPMATDLARLSLWLATLARDHEFTFLDHALRVGDSLVGLSRSQVARLDWRDEAQGSLFGGLVRERLTASIAARAAIRAANDDVAVFEQERRLAIAEQHLGELRLAGDAVIAAHFSAERDRARGLAVELLQGTATNTDALWAALRGSAATLKTGPHPLRPFHWELEFPEVFAGDERGFDAIVGNPPFAGKNTLLSSNRTGYLPWLQAAHSGVHGNADLVAHFFRRAFDLIRPGGCFGLISTNTIGQGDTRESGLRWLLGHDGVITRAVRRLAWPGEAAVVVSVVHVVRGSPPPLVIPTLDGREVRRISAYLVEGNLDASPARLAANHGIAFIGDYICGSGFTFDDVGARRGKATSIAVKDELLTNDTHNSQRIAPYIGGAEANNHPQHLNSRWVIKFDDFPLGRVNNVKLWANMSDLEREDMSNAVGAPIDYPLPVAEDWPNLLDIVARLVRPERIHLPLTNSWNRTIAKYWWRWGAFRKGLHAAIQDNASVWFHANLGPHLAFSRLRSDVIIGAPHNVITDSSFEIFAVLQSRVHEIWARSFSSSFKDDLRYTPSDTFEPFPFPNMVENVGVLAQIGQDYHEFRAGLLVRNNEGLTRNYNKFHDSSEISPTIMELRELHHSMDVAVLRAYGWRDLADSAMPVFLADDSEPTHCYQNRFFWPGDYRDEVLSRLLALNVERASAEATAGLSPSPASDGFENLVAEDADA